MDDPEGLEAKANMGCIQRKKQPQGSRRIVVNQNHLHKGYKSNATSTTKYNLFTYFPKALFEQYRYPRCQRGAASIPAGQPRRSAPVLPRRRVANIYFTIVAALSLTPYSPVR